MQYINLLLGVGFTIWFAVDLIDKDYSWPGAKGTGICAAANLFMFFHA